MTWYYAENGQQRGPVTDEQLEELVRSGKLAIDTLIWREGMADWQPLQQVKPGVKPPTPVQSSASPEIGPGAVCNQCKKMFNLSEMTQYGEAYICPNCKPAYSQKAGVPAGMQAGAMTYGGFWIRFAAKIVDGLILGAVVFVPLFILIFFVAFRAAASSGPNSMLGSLFGTTGSQPDLFTNFIGLIAQLIFIAINGVYTIFFLGKYGATPGKMICGLRVVTADGDRIGYGRATGRFFAEILSGMICYIGYIIAGFDNEKRALHDHICSTRVVYK